MCYCGKPEAFSDCCQPFVEGQYFAPTPEHLMRSRYSAYVLKLSQYIFDTYAQEQRSANTISDIDDFAQACDFIKLEIIESIGPTDSSKDKGIVEFKAHYLMDNKYYILHEHSNFVYREPQWFYLDGAIKQIPAISLNRNTLCPCGSGKKFKRCHALTQK